MRVKSRWRFIVSKLERVTPPVASPTQGHGFTLCTALRRRGAPQQWPFPRRTCKLPRVIAQVATTPKTALICGVGGQDGAWLAKLLLERGYRVVGTSRDAAM